MKITKLTHSCLVIEQDGKKVLTDPGSYSWLDEVVKQHDFSGIDAVVITHIHPDHFNEEFVKAIYLQSPAAAWYGTNQVVEALAKLGITGLSSSEDTDVIFVSSDHADLSPWFDAQPEHTSFKLFNRILISGDCQTLRKMYGARILAGAINGGPWGAVVGFAKMVEAMDEKPEIVVPIHDWHWNEQARNSIYTQLPQVMNKFGIIFEPLSTAGTKNI